MGETVLLSILAVFVLVSAIALCIQAAYLAGVYKTVRLLQQKVVPLVPKVESFVEAARSTLETTRSTVELARKQIGEITTKTTEILESAKGQVAKIDGIVTDAADRARSQMERVEMVLDDTMSRIQETVVVVHNGVMRPLRQIDGVSKAIRAIFWHFFGRRRPSPTQVTSDEEMFI